MLHSWCDKTVAVKRAPMVADGYRAERDWTQARTHTVAGCALVRPSTSTDFNDPSRVRAIDMLLLAPPGADIAEGDRVSIGGKTFEIDGVPIQRQSPTGAVDHVRAALVAWSG